MKLADTKINATWHKAHHMPKNPTPPERLRWHLDHENHCHCRTLTVVARQKLLAAAKK